MEFILAVVIIVGVFFLIKRLREPLLPKTTGTIVTGGGGGDNGDDKSDKLTLVNKI